MPTIRLAFSVWEWVDQESLLFARGKGGRLTLNRSEALFPCLSARERGGFWYMKSMSLPVMESFLCARMLLSVCCTSHWILTAIPFHKRSKCTSVWLKNLFKVTHISRWDRNQVCTAPKTLESLHPCSLVQVTQRAHVHGVVERIPRSLQIPHLLYMPPTKHFVDIYQND